MNAQDKKQRNSKIQRRRSFGLRQKLLLLGASAVVIAIAARATTPALKITSLGDGDFQLTVTNSATNDSYQIYYTPNFDPGYQWNVLLVGSGGQTNFTVSVPPNGSGFYQAVAVGDFDNDGIPNWEDANPTNGSVGILTVIIDTPTNHYTFR